MKNKETNQQTNGRKNNQKENKKKVQLYFLNFSELYG